MHISDQELLERVTAGRDRSAADELLSRYGALVWGVCERMLEADEDAASAFLACFLAARRRQPDGEDLGCEGLERGLALSYGEALQDQACLTAQNPVSFRFLWRTSNPPRPWRVRPPTGFHSSMSVNPPSTSRHISPVPC